jgi:NDP-sugar pyrophosphorylase family protein
MDAARDPRLAVVGVIPAAGYGTRLGHIHASKEVLEIGGRPLIDHLVAHLRAAPCTEIRVVTRPEKSDVIDHARRIGIRVVEGHPPSLAGSIHLGLQGLDDEAVICLGFPDCLWEPLEGFRTLIESVRAGADVCLGLFRSNQPERYDTVALEPGGERVVRIDVKPREPRTALVWGCAAARAGTVRPLAQEHDPGAFFGRLCRGGTVTGRWLSDTWIDVGVPDALSEARRAGGAPSVANFDPAADTLAR